MAYYIINYNALVDGKIVASGTQGATPIYDQNALKNKLKPHFKNRFPYATRIEIIVVAKNPVSKEAYWEAQKNFNP